MQIHEDNYLTSEDEIVEYFTDSHGQFFDCGQGYYQDEAELFTQIDDQFYLIKITAEVISSKQDVGDRLYWVDRITGVTYEKVTRAHVVSVVNRDIQSQIDALYKKISKLEDSMFV